MKYFVKKYWLLILVILFHIVCNIIWLKMDRTPPAWDQAAHIKNAIVWGREIKGELSLSFKNLIGQSWGYPPLAFFLGGLWTLMVGENVDAISFLGTIFLIATIIGVFKLTFEITKDKKITNTAIILFSFFPAIIDISRDFLLDLLLLAWVAWGGWSFIKSNNFLNFKYNFWFLLFLVLASLTKINGFVYFFPFVGVGVWQSIKQKNLEIISNLVILGLIYGLSVGWWWVVNYQNIIHYIGEGSRGEKLTDPMDLLSWVTWFHYFKLFFLYLVSPITGLVFLVSLSFWKKFDVLKRKKQILFWFILINYVFFTIIRNKDFRYVMPLLSVVPAIIVLGLNEIRKINNLFFKGLLVILVVYNFINYFSNSFQWPIKKEYKLSVKTFLFDWVDVINISNYPIRSVRSEKWPHDQIVNDFIDGSKVLVLINREELNDNNLRLYMVLKNKDLYLGSTESRVRFNSQEELEGLLNKYDYFLVSDGNYEPAPFYSVNLESIKQARDFLLNSDEYQKIAEYVVFGDKKVFLMKGL